MRFKSWILKEIGGNGPGGFAPQQRPDLFATALPAFSKGEEPVPNKKTPTKGYVVGALVDDKAKDVYSSSSSKSSSSRSSRSSSSSSRSSSSSS